MAIGIVRGIIGKVLVTDAKGSVRELRVGDAVELNDNVQASAGGTVHIAFNNGNFATIGSNETLMLSEAVMDPTAAKAQVAEGQSVADIQAMIAAGMDPTQIAEATAAGADAGLAGDTGQGGHSFVVVNQDAARGEVTPGFDTSTFGNLVSAATTEDGRFLMIGEEETVAPVGPDADTLAHLNVDEAGLRSVGNTSESAPVVVDGYTVVGVVSQGAYGTVVSDGNGGWTYTLNGPSDLGDGQGANVVEGADTIRVQVSDGAGNLFEVDVKVDIRDDMPDLTANTDLTAVGGHDSAMAASGSFSFDFGADNGDGKSFTVNDMDFNYGDLQTAGHVDIKGEHGTLTINADGSYVYKADGDAGKGEDKFDFTIRDADGDEVSSSINVTLTPNGVPEIVGDKGDGLNLKESGVGDKTETGINDGWAEGPNQAKINGIQSDYSSFTVKDADGDSLKATLVDADNRPISGVVTDEATGKMTLVTDYGTLTVTPTTNGDGTVTYDYKFDLNDKAVNELSQFDPDNPQEGVNYQDMNFQINVSDGHGGSISQDVNIRIEGTNDAPTFNNKGQNVHLKESGVFDGNHDTTEDGQNNGAVQNANQRTEVHGNLSTNVTDPDTDKSKLTYTIDSLDVSTKVAMKVDTALLDASGKQVVDADNKPVNAHVEIIGTPTIDPATGFQTIETNYGTLTLDTRTGEYSFKLGGTEAAEKLLNEMAQGDKFTFQFRTTVTDDHGAQGHHVLGVVIEGANDAPTLTVSNSSLSAGSDQDQLSGTYEGKDEDRGAELKYTLVENGHQTDIAEGKYGHLELTDDGQYKYVLDTDSDAYKNLGKDGDTESFTIRVTDEHGAYSEQTITVAVSAGVPPVINEHITVDEAGLNNAGNTSETYVLNAPEGYTILGVASQGQYGDVELNSTTGKWEYTLKGAYDHIGGQGTDKAVGADSVTITYKDETTGREFEVKVDVDIIDGVPTIGATDPGTVDYGSQTIDGHVDLNFGADGQHVNADGVQDGIALDGYKLASSEGEGGDRVWHFENNSGDKVDLHANGDFTYTQGGGHGAVNNDTLHFTITDHDGDTASKDVNLTINPGHSVTEGGNTHDVIEGKPGLSNDMIFGDEAGSATVVQPGKDYNISILLDLSDSMNVRGENGVSRMEMMIDGVKHYLDSLKGHDGVINLQIIGFEGHAFKIADTTITAGEFPSKGSSTQLLDKIIEYLDYYYEHGPGFNATTNTGDALTKATDWFGSPEVESSRVNNGNENHLYLLTDGNPNDWAPDSGSYDKITNFKDKYGDDVTIHTVGVGNDQGNGNDQWDMNTDALQDWATGGKDGNNWSLITSGDQLSAALENGSSTTTGKPMGSDLIFGGDGNDIAFGEAFVYEGKHGYDAIREFVHKEAPGLDIDKQSNVMDYIREHADVFNDYLNAHPSDMGKADLMIGGAGDDLLFGQDGNDVLIGDGTLHAGSDIAGYLHEHGVITEHLDFAAGNDLGHNIGALGDALHGMDHSQLNDFADWAQDNLGAGDHKGGGDLLYGGAGDDILIGGSGNDVLHGGDGNDILMGGHGNDTLIGGHGDNILIGGDGHDTFKYNAGDLEGKVHGDTIMDFTVGEDKLDIGDLLTGLGVGSGTSTDINTLIDGGYLNIESKGVDDKGNQVYQLTIDADGNAGSGGAINLAEIHISGVHSETVNTSDLLQQMLQNQHQDGKLG